MDDEMANVPTASIGMLQPSSVSELNELTNGALNKFHKKNSRVRSKSESAHTNVERTKSDDIVGLVVKSNKDRNHDRKPRNLKGLGKPKKGGGGGKGTWGKNGEIYEEENEDENDPNFDDDRAKEKDAFLLEVKPDLSAAEFDKVVAEIIKEFYNHTVTEEVADALAGINIAHLKHRIIYLTIAMAMERKNSERELTSILLSDLFGMHVFTEQEAELGFQALMNALNDLVLDTPDAPQILGKFIARCIADDCLNPVFIKDHLLHPTELSKVALETANNLLHNHHGIARLDNIWGFGGGIRPVKKLVKKIILLIKEFLSSGDINEAERCVTDLEVPHFHHEIVYEAIMIALEDGTDNTITDITEFFRHFSESTIITMDQMKTGFERVFNNMDDIVLDIPWAYRHLDALLNQCCRKNILSIAFRQKAPHRGRKRYVSEGDFGFSNAPIIPK